MTKAVTTAAVTEQTMTWRRRFSRNGFVLSVWLLLGVLLAGYAALIPRFGNFQIVSISKNSLPLAYLAIGQALIVIAGGVDLSVGALMLLGNAIAARFMDGQPLPVVMIMAIAIIVGIGLLNGLVGIIISISTVPDIVVTLATSFIWSGVALWILPSPGGGTAPQFRWLFTGSESGIGGSFVMPVLMMAIPALLVYLFATRTLIGLSIYAVGSDSLAARLAGLDIQRAKIASYAIGGAMAALAGLATVALTGTGDPRFSVGANATLNSVAAVVLGGVALTGGVGSVPGVVAAAIILVMLNPILSAMGVNPNNAQVIQGVFDCGGDDVGWLVSLAAGASLMSQSAVKVNGSSWLVRLQILAAERPSLILSIVLIALIFITGAVEPEYLSVSGIRNTMLQAAPLGILAGAQTILMLTGGIDLSITMIATGSAYVAANQSPSGAVIAILLGMVVGLLAGTTNGVGVAVFRVNPLIMTLALSGILLGLFTAWTQTILQGATQVAPFIKLMGTGSFFGNRIPYSVIVWLIVSVGLIWLLRRTGWGRLLYAIGDNDVAVRLAGVQVWQVRITAYAVAGGAWFD